MSKTGTGRWGKLRSAIGSLRPDPVSVGATAREEKIITIVSGLPRSGTSMMMSMLEAGGVPPLTDKERTADDDNPKGYYEFERVKQLDKGDAAWLPDARGKAVKVIAALLKHLPVDYSYKVIFMGRKLEEILQSQKQMLIRREKTTDSIDDGEMAALFSKHLDYVKHWLGEQANFEVLYVSYNEILENPADQAQRINRFLGVPLDLENMANVIDQRLYRQRR